MNKAPEESLQKIGQWTVLICIVLLALTSVRSPEDYKVSQFGTATLLPPAILKGGKLVARGLCFLLLGHYLIQFTASKRLNAALWSIWPIVGFCGYILLSTAWSPLKSVTFVQAASFTLLILLSLTVGLSARSELDYSRILKWLTVVLAVAAAALIVLHFGVPRCGALTKRSSGLFHATMAGASSSLAILILLLSRILWKWRWSRTLWVPCILLHLSVMLIGGNRLSLILAVVLGGLCIVLLAPSYKVAFALLPGALFATAFLSVDPRLEVLRTGIAETGEFLSQGQTTTQLKGMSGRTEMWQVMWNSFLDSPLMGHGHFVTSSKGEVYVWYEWGNWTAHNFMLQLLTTTGLLGAVLLFSGYLFLAYKVAVSGSRDYKMPTCMLVLTTWFVGWGVLNESYIGPVQPESIVFSLVVGFGIAIAINRQEPEHATQHAMELAS